MLQLASQCKALLFSFNAVDKQCALIVLLFNSLINRYDQTRQCTNATLLT